MNRRDPGHGDRVVHKCAQVVARQNLTRAAGLQDGGVIAGTVISPATKLPGVLFVHGWGGSQQQYLARAREVAGLGAVCMTFDLTGHAGTAAQYETVSRMRNLADVLAAYDMLVRFPGATTRG